MTTLDWIIVGFVLLMALWGYLQGLVVSTLSLLGFALGAFAGSRLVPLLLAQGSKSPYAPMFGLVGALFVGGVVAAVLEEAGSKVRRRIAILGPVAILDGLFGAVLIAAVGLGLAWLGGAVALHAPGATGLRKDIQRSTILRRLNDLMPPSGPILNALSRVDPFPSVNGPAARVAEPTRGILADRDVKRARASVVKVTGTACGLAVEGSGWVARSRLVVTNAHVVAGQDDTTVQLEDGPELDTEAVAFNVHDDIAVLRVDGLHATALPTSSSTPVGAPVAILGYPENGPFRSVPGRLGATETVISQDAYGAGPTQRRMTALRGAIRSGNSGGPAVDAHGRVVATVFAASRSRPRSGFGVPAAIVDATVSGARGPVGTGPCAR
jgi:S1-C subfamily serine protease